MQYKLIQTASYLKKASKFFKKRPELLEKYAKTLAILEHNPQHPSLRLHKLQGNLRQYHSVSIDMSYRLVIDFVIHESKIILIAIGTHQQVY